jgi:outer membrane protein assembly factor BamE (lipoprotein component of BamABCDE complex)
MPRSRPKLRALLLLPLLLLGACSVFASPIQNRGNRVDSDVLGELVVGTSTKADVTALIGSPTARATFDDDTWIYIGLQTRQRIGRTLGVEAMDNTVLTFNDQGVLSTVKRLNDDDSLPVEVVSRTTPSPGSEASFMQMLLGNVGRYNPVSGAPKTGGGGNAGSGPPGASGPGQGL